MSTSDFINPIQNTTSSLNGIRSSQSTDKQIQRQQRLAELKNQVQSGTYNIDLQQLSKQVLKSGVLNNE